MHKCINFLNHWKFCGNKINILNKKLIVLLIFLYRCGCKYSFQPLHESSTFGRCCGGCPDCQTAGRTQCQDWCAQWWTEHTSTQGLPVQPCSSGGVLSRQVRFCGVGRAVIFLSNTLNLHVEITVLKLQLVYVTRHIINNWKALSYCRMKTKIKLRYQNGYLEDKFFKDIFLFDIWCAGTGV